MANVLPVMVIRHLRNDIQNSNNTMQKIMIYLLKKLSFQTQHLETGFVNMGMNLKILSIKYIKEDIGVHIVKASKHFKDSMTLNIFILYLHKIMTKKRMATKPVKLLFLTEMFTLSVRTVIHLYGLLYDMSN